MRGAAPVATGRSVVVLSVADEIELMAVEFPGIAVVPLMGAVLVGAAVVNWVPGAGVEYGTPVWGAVAEAAVGAG